MCAGIFTNYRRCPIANIKSGSIGIIQGGRGLASKPLQARSLSQYWCYNLIIQSKRIWYKTLYDKLFILPIACCLLPARSAVKEILFLFFSFRTYAWGTEFKGLRLLSFPTECYANGMLRKRCRLLSQSCAEAMTEILYFA